jgi:hypothetical protein
MGGWDLFIDLTEDRSPVFDRTFAPGPHTLTPDFVREGKLCTVQDATSYTGIIQRTEASCSGIERRVVTLSPTLAGRVLTL